MTKPKNIKILVQIKLKEIRLRQDISQAELAKKAKLHLSSIQRMERSPQNLTLENLEALANALGVGIHDLIPKSKRPTKPVTKSFSTSRDALEFAIEVLRNYQTLEEDDST